MTPSEEHRNAEEIILRLEREFDPDMLSRLIDEPIDKAVRKIDVGSMKTASRHTLLDIVAKFVEQFHAHAFPHGRQFSGELARSEAMALLNRTHALDGYEGALLAVLDNTEQAVYSMFSEFTALYKQDHRNRHTMRVTMTVIDPCSWVTRLAIVARLLERCGTGLPAQVATCAPSQFADNLLDLFGLTMVASREKGMVRAYCGM